jgi:hypothetical protein
VVPRAQPLILVIYPARVHNDICVWEKRVGGGDEMGNSKKHQVCLRATHNLTAHWQAWACVRVDSAPPGTVCPSPPDLACFVYDEEKGAFYFWGPNSALLFTKATAAAKPLRP